MTTLPATPAAPTGPDSGLRFRALLEDGIGVLKSHFVPIALPLIVLSVITGGGQSDARFDAADVPSQPQDLLVFIPLFAMLGVVALAVVVLLFFAYAMASLMAARAAVDAAEGRAPMSFGEQWREAWPRILPASGTFLLALLFVVLGFIALVVPGFVVMAALTPLAAVVAMERRAGMDAIKRAWALSRGHRGALFLLILLTLVTVAIGSATVSWIPILGRALAGIVGGVGSAFLATVGALYWRRATAAP